MNYQFARFELLPEQIEEKKFKEKEKLKLMNEECDIYVKKHNLKILFSDYLNCSKYYIDQNDIICKHTWGKWENVSGDEEFHIRQLNKI